MKKSIRSSIFPTLDMKSKNLIDRYVLRVKKLTN